ncbi:MAG TPA: amino acid ABC transporter permease [Lachnoclostridium phytofermentans]|uniref:Amino acid ABC transporter permease n=1 Tax=Lachnoclostridium phytofermentans TaxID=66219 RepID=A0A3D2X684_9FIRM|nr:amino acid ABC transporter permease [Lachnoclostridium sp.]HCL02065.1 amino acid ABC transporter permease [Lachnoclostridium phytofermentans]
MQTGFQDFCDRFVLNFIEDNRYMYLVRGLITTLIVTFFAVLIGALLGFIIAIIRSTYSKTGKLRILNFLCNIYITVIRGTPVVVQLLIIYFVIFGSVNINKIFVAVLAFGLNSGAYVAEIVRSGIMAVDEGQFEAGRSLGFNYAQTMRLIILPQAIKNILPALGNEFIVLLKETSVSGFIALEDLTKAGDIIRGRTYDAFMPLIAVALIYLVLVIIFTKLVNRLERRLRNSDH